MRRMLAVALLLSAVSVPARATTRPAPAIDHVPGRRSLVPATGDAWLRQQWDAIAGEPRLVYDAVQRVNAIHGVDRGSLPLLSPYRYDEYFVRTDVGDFDGDRVPDLFAVNDHIELGSSGWWGNFWFTALSGRTGKVLWTREYLHSGLLFALAVAVGAEGRPGMLFVDLSSSDLGVTTMRLDALYGRTGTPAWTQTITGATPREAVSWGGLLDAYPRGGTDVLFSLVTSPPSAGISVSLVDVPNVYVATPYTIDGKDGRVRAVHPTEAVVGAGLLYLPTGDLDGDKRDDFFRVRGDGGERATITAYSTVEDKTLWERPGLPGPASTDDYFSIPKSGDLVGGRGDDLILLTRTYRDPLLPGVTDTYPVGGGSGAGQHLLVLDGANGAVVTHLKYDRFPVEYFQLGDDVNHDGKADLYATETTADDEKYSVTFRVLSGRGALLLRRVASLPWTRLAMSGMSEAGFTGDMDGDGAGDFFYRLTTSSLPNDVRRTTGMALTHGKSLVTLAEGTLPFWGTLDGGTQERVVIRGSKGSATFTVYDGVTDRAYWTLKASGPAEVTWALQVVPGARGRCDGALLVGRQPKDGGLWIVSLDGATGQPRWSTTLEEPRPKTTVTASGPHASCR